MTNKKMRYTVFISSLGSALEYYCFVIYIMLSAYLGKVFFPSQDQYAATLNTLLIFAIGYVVMPISAFSFGFIADRLGRKKVMLIAIMVMAFATLLIGILPTYSAIGVFAPICLVILRMAQGLAQGAELPGAITFINEHADDKNQARFTGFLFFAVGTGALLSTFVNYVLTNVLSEQDMLAFGWRIPFLFAGFLGIVGYKLRVGTLETPAFLNQKREELAKIPIFEVIKEHFSKILIGFGLVWGGAVLVNFGLYLPSFLQTNFGYAAKDTYLAMVAAFAIDFLLIVFGIIADRISLRKFYIIGAVVNVLLLYPICSLLQLKTTLALYAANILIHLLVLLLASCYPSMITRLFPTKVRYSGVALAYLGAYSIAGIVPFFVNKLYVYYGSFYAVIGFLIFSSIVSLAAGIFYREIK